MECGCQTPWSTRHIFISLATLPRLWYVVDMSEEHDRNTTSPTSAETADASAQQILRHTGVDVTGQVFAGVACPGLVPGLSAHDRATVCVMSMSFLLSRFARLSSFLSFLTSCSPYTQVILHFPSSVIPLLRIRHHTAQPNCRSHESSSRSALPYPPLCHSRAWTPQRLQT